MLALGKDETCVIEISYLRVKYGSWPVETKFNGVKKVVQEERVESL